MKMITAKASGEIAVVDSDASLHWFQQAVGGYIEIVRVPMLQPDHVMVVDDEGLYKDYQLNLLGSFFYRSWEHGSPVVGDIVIVSEHRTAYSADFVDMTDSLRWSVAYQHMLDEILKRVAQ